MATEIEIYRFGRLMNVIPDNKTHLRAWIIANVQPLTKYADVLPDNASLSVCLDTAKERHYTFRRVAVKEPKKE